MREFHATAYASSKFQMSFVTGAHAHDICHRGIGWRTYPAWLTFQGIGEGGKLPGQKLRSMPRSTGSSWGSRHERQDGVTESPSDGDSVLLDCYWLAV